MPFPWKSIVKHEQLSRKRMDDLLSQEEDVMVRGWFFWVLIGLWLLCSSLARCQQARIGVGDCLGAPATTITVPIEVSSATPLTALNVRLRFDPSVLTFAGLARGPLPTPEHMLYYQPLPGGGEGWLNVVVYAPAGAPAFRSLSGTVAELTFAVSPEARVPSATFIVFETDGSALMPASDLSDLAGASVPHRHAYGRVSFVTTARNWSLYE
jgi:hypothetical protein